MRVSLHFPKLSRFSRDAEPATVAVPFAEGALPADTAVAVVDGDIALPTQSRPTANWPDGSVKWLLADFLANLPANAPTDLVLRAGEPPPTPLSPARAKLDEGAARMEAGPLSVSLNGPGECGLLREVTLEGEVLAAAGELMGPEIAIGGRSLIAQIDAAGWRIAEPGPVRVVVEASGRHRGADGGSALDFVARVTVWAGKPWCEVHYRVIDREPTEGTSVEAARWCYRPDGVSACDTEGAVTVSNYVSRTQTAEPGETVRRVIDAQHLLFTSNEQVPEVLYGTFTGHWRHPKRGGLSATIFQAYQNYPKALSAGGDGLAVELVPADTGGLELMRGMARGHRFLLHCHDGDEPLEGLIVRALQYQMPDRPVLPPAVYRRAGVVPDVFVDEPVARVERTLIDLADRRTRAFGMLHWGDGPERGYTDQGRGRGELVWCNLEYDLPRAALLMYARTGERRMLDYLLVSAEHWMEIDTCHDSDDPLRHQGMIAHSARHATGGVTISHEWVEGILDYYHQTGDPFALDTALGIGRNVLRHLERLMERGTGAFSARETGWGLRTLVALYEETHDESWLAPAERIVDHFEAWMDEHGTWLSPYTDHTLVRVPFMITVAANGLMCHYRVRPEERIARMVVHAMDDLIEHCLMPDGRFYYKELPSLQRRGAGTQVLQGLAHAWELTGDVKYLRAGMTSFDLSLDAEAQGWSGAKYSDGDAVIDPRGPGPKAFAAEFLPVARFYAAAVRAGLLRPDDA